MPDVDDIKDTLADALEDLRARVIAALEADDDEVSDELLDVAAERDHLAEENKLLTEQLREQRRKNTELMLELKKARAGAPKALF